MTTTRKTQFTYGLLLTDLYQHYSRIITYGFVFVGITHGFKSVSITHRFVDITHGHRSVGITHRY